MSLPHFDKSKYVLGNLCNRQHDWNTTGSSLRRLSDGRCFECESSRLQQYYINNREKVLLRTKLYDLENREAVNLRKKLYTQRRRLTGEPQKAFKKYQQSEKGKAMFRYHNRLRKARRKKVALLPYSFQGLTDRFNEFEGKCAYCDKQFLDSGVRVQVDHFLPISKGGTDVLGNIIPACPSCNASKNNNDPIEWFRSKGFPEQRLAKVLKVLGKTEDNYNQIPLL